MRQLLMAMLLVATAAAQPGITINTVNYGSLPQVKLRISPKQGSPNQFSLSASRISVFENGKERNALIQCHDSTTRRNVVFCIDISSSMLIPPAIEDVKYTAREVIDSLRPGDKAGVIGFASKRKIYCPLISDLDSVRSAIKTLYAGGGTALYDGIQAAISLLAGAVGDKYIILLSDGGDNSSRATLNGVAKEIRESGIIFINIPFSNPGGDVEEQLKLLTTLSNGFYYPVVNSAGLQQVFHRIARSFVEPYCDILYTGDGCRDSLRHIQVVVDDALGTFSADTNVVSPVAPQSLVLEIRAPSDATPGSRPQIDVLLHGALGTSRLRFDLRIVFPGEYLQLSTTPVVAGSIVGNQEIEVTLISRDTLRVATEGILPRMASGTLFSLTLPIPDIDSSRSYPISISGVSISQDCDVPFSVIADTIDVCACHAAYTALLHESKVYAAKEEIRVPVFIDLKGDMHRIVESFVRVTYDTSIIQWNGFSTENTMMENGIFSPVLLNDGAIQFHCITPQKVASDQQPLCILQFTTGERKSATSVTIAIDSAKIYSRCCPVGHSGFSGTVFIDGFCEKLLTRNGTLGQSSPNPTTGNAIIPIHLTQEETVILTLHTANGTLVRELFSGKLPQGSHYFPVALTDQANGTYYYSLTTSAGTLTKSILLIRD